MIYIKNILSRLALVLVCVTAYTACAQQSNTESVTTNGPTRITRNVIQDNKGNMWMAAFDGIFKYDGKVFTNISSKVTPSRFFSILQDSKGNLWFGSLGVGVYRYDGNTFQNFSTKDGLLNNEVTSIYEDKSGNMWFGVYGGASRYDGKTFRNYILEGETMKPDDTVKPFLYRHVYEVTFIVESKTGKLWFATRGNTFIYDGKTFTPFYHGTKPFRNVRSVIEDKKGNIWLGGKDGLWRYNGTSLSYFTQNFVGNIMEDKKGNIWISSESTYQLTNFGPGNPTKAPAWALSRFDESTLNDKRHPVKEITTMPLVFGITEDDKGNIWFGAIGVHRYDGKTVYSYNNKQAQQ